MRDRYLVRVTGDRGQEIDSAKTRRGRHRLSTPSKQRSRLCGNSARTRSESPPLRMAGPRFTAGTLTAAWSPSAAATAPSQ